MLNFKSEMCPERIKGGRGGETTCIRKYKENISLFWELGKGAIHVFIEKSLPHISISPDRKYLKTFSIKKEFIASVVSGSKIHTVYTLISRKNSNHETFLSQIAQFCKL